jgi:hypothetical protein
MCATTITIVMGQIRLVTTVIFPSSLEYLFSSEGICKQFCFPNDVVLCNYFLMNRKVF